MDWNKASLRVFRPERSLENAVPVGFPAFAPIVSDAFDYLTNLPDGRPLKIGQVLLVQGSTAESVYLLRDGLVKLTHLTCDGREATLGLRSAGWYAGAVSVMMKMPTVYAVTALTVCSVSRICAADFALTLSQNAKLMRHFLYTLCNESMSQSASQAQMMGGSAEDRLKHFLRERKSVHPRVKTMDTLPLLKQLDLARLLSITPEHLSRLMHKASAEEEFSGFDKEKRLPRVRPLATTSPRTPATLLAGDMPRHFAEGCVSG